MNQPTIYIVAFLKNESLYLREWLSYHLSFGVTGILLYDNNTDPEERKRTREITDSFENVWIKDWNQYDEKSRFGIFFKHSTKAGKFAMRHGTNKQHFISDDAIRICKERGVDYLLKIDIDEFISGEDPDIRHLHEALARMKNGGRLERINFDTEHHPVSYTHLTLPTKA